MDSNILKLIKIELSCYSSIQFQNRAAIILSECYKKLGYDYENPNPAGGDDKNDGWVKGTGIYYQFYSPTNYPKSFEKNVFNKFETDAKGLFENVYVKNLWEKPINKFIFIVNTRDVGIPKDSKRRCEKCIESLNKLYNAHATYILANVDYLTDLLLEVDDSKVERNILIKLEIDGLLNYSNLDEKVMIQFLDLLSRNIQESMLIGEGSNYERVSTESKISINNLNEYKDKINFMITKLNVVESAMSDFERNDPLKDISDKTTKIVINLYNQLKAQYSGIDLYDRILSGILAIAPELKSFVCPAEFFMIYVFDKCDIFEKE